ncbi:MAG: hypothetical protein V4553_08800 [Bacteroidota bacterium]
MLQITSDKRLFITYGQRSREIFSGQLYGLVTGKYGTGTFNEQHQTAEILNFCYDWTADKFIQIIVANQDTRFLYYLFENHESSIHLYYRTAEKNFDKEKINENTLSLNRRILKLALEQTCDIDYVTNKEPLTRQIATSFVLIVEDLLYLGERLFAYSEHLAEQRMMENPIEIVVSPSEVKVQRNYHYDQVYRIMEKFFQEGFKEGLVDSQVIKELRAQLEICMGINYDFAGGQIFQMKRHHAPDYPLYQTIQPEALIQNLIHNGVDEQSARNFYEGLTISRHNKLTIKNSVYLSGSFHRYMFRPILILNKDGEERAWVGDEKWQESILVMATNGFQWQLAPEEWKLNDCFLNYLSSKHDEHDKILEKEVIKILDKRKVCYDYHIEKLINSKGVTIDIIANPGEIDFIIVDSTVKKILVTDCKYHRARYEMTGFSNDFSHFKKYEKQMKRKLRYVADNLSLIQEHFQRLCKLTDLDLSAYKIDGLFIVNTPTFYIFNGMVKTITIGHLEEFMEDGYEFGDITLKDKDNNSKTIKHPYFTIQ